MFLVQIEAWDDLAHSLAVASASRSVPGPGLRLLEDRGRALSLEMQSCLERLR